MRKLQNNLRGYFFVHPVLVWRRLC